MTTTRRSVMWPLVVIAIGCLWLLMVAGAFPAALGDILVRAWPALLVLFGLDVLVGRRRLRVGGRGLPLNVVGLLLTVALLAGVVWLAYDRQADKVRSDTVQTFAQALGEDVAQVRLEIAVERTAVTIAPSEAAERSVGAEFKGSKASTVNIAWAVDGDTGVLTVSETYGEAIPKLEEYGRGTLTITLPAGTPVQLVSLDAASGTVTMDLRPLRVERVEAKVGQGDLRLTLPAQDVLTGLLQARDGGIYLDVPAEMALTVGLEPGSGKPRYEYDSLRYEVLLEGTLKRKNADPFQIALTVWVKSGAPLVVTDLEAP